MNQPGDSASSLMKNPQSSRSPLANADVWQTQTMRGNRSICGLKIYKVKSKNRKCGLCGFLLLTQYVLFDTWTTEIKEYREVLNWITLLIGSFTSCLLPRHTNMICFLHSQTETLAHSDSRRCFALWMCGAAEPPLVQVQSLRSNKAWDVMMSFFTADDSQRPQWQEDSKCGHLYIWQEIQRWPYLWTGS